MRAYETTEFLWGTSATERLGVPYTLFNPIILVPPRKLGFGPVLPLNSKVQSSHGYLGPYLKFIKLTYLVKGVQELYASTTKLPVSSVANPGVLVGSGSGLHKIRIIPDPVFKTLSEPDPVWIICRFKIHLKLNFSCSIYWYIVIIQYSF